MNLVHHEVPPSCCPHCGNINDHATPTRGTSVPRSGDVSICINCGGIALWNNSMQLRPPADHEQGIIFSDPTIAKTVENILVRRLTLGR